MISCIAHAARGAGVSVKTAREHYLALRARLTQPCFARWHKANTLLVSIDSKTTDELVRPAFFDWLAQCHANGKCAQNYRLGYRAARICRTCPLADKFTNSERRDEALALIDAVRDFYVRLGIKGEKDRDPMSLFRERLIHMVSISTASANSRTRTDGLKDPMQKSYLSVGTLLDLLLEELAERPL